MFYIQIKNNQIKLKRQTKKAANEADKARIHPNDAQVKEDEIPFHYVSVLLHLYYFISRYYQPNKSCRKFQRFFSRKIGQEVQTLPDMTLGVYPSQSVTFLVLYRRFLGFGR